MTGRDRANLDALLFCARSDSVRDPGRLRARLAGVAEEDLLLAARQHGMTGLVHDRLIRPAWDGFGPPPVHGSLRRQLDRILVHNLKMLREVLRLVGALQDRGVNAVPFKGPILAVHLHGHAGMRRCGDIDLYVPPAELAAARAVLAELGYRRDPVACCPVESAFLHCRGNHEVHRHDELGFLLELHWQTLPRRFLRGHEEGPIWRRVVSVPFGRRTVPVLRPESLLLLLCVHGAKHLWYRLGWVVDVARLVEGWRDLDWPWLLAEARRRGTLRMLLLGVVLAHRLGAPLPDPLRGPVGAARPLLLRLESAVRWHQLHHGLDDRVPLPRELVGFYLAVKERLIDRIALVLQCLLVPTAADRGSLLLPSWLEWLRPLLRPARLAWRLMRSKLPRGGEATPRSGTTSRPGPWRGTSMLS